MRKTDGPGCWFTKADGMRKTEVSMSLLTLKRKVVTLSDVAIAVAKQFLHCSDALLCQIA